MPEYELAPWFRVQPVADRAVNRAAMALLLVKVDTCICSTDDHELAGECEFSGDVVYLDECWRCWGISRREPAEVDPDDELGLCQGCIVDLRAGSLPEPVVDKYGRALRQVRSPSP